MASLLIYDDDYDDDGDGDVMVMVMMMMMMMVMMMMLVVVVMMMMICTYIDDFDGLPNTPFHPPSNFSYEMGKTWATVQIASQHFFVQTGGVVPPILYLESFCIWNHFVCS